MEEAVRLVFVSKTLQDFVVQVTPREYEIHPEKSLGVVYSDLNRRIAFIRSEPAKALKHFKCRRYGDLGIVEDDMTMALRIIKAIMSLETPTLKSFYEKYSNSAPAPATRRGE